MNENAGAKVPSGQNTTGSYGGASDNASYASRAAGSSRFSSGQRNGSRRATPRTAEQVALDPPLFYRPYAFIPAREVERSDQDVVRKTLELLHQKGYVLRVSGLNNTAPLFASLRSELILPWKNFADLESKHTYTSEEARYLAALHYPNFATAKLPFQGFLSTNVRLIFGDKLNSVALFLLVYCAVPSEDTDLSTVRSPLFQHALAIANAAPLSIYNLFLASHRARLSTTLGLLS